MKKILTLLLALNLTLTAAAETLDQLRQRAQSGDPEAQYLYAEALRKGGYENDSIPKDIAEALNWYRKAAEQGVEQTQIHLGKCYDYGLGVESNMAEAMKWYKKAADQGSAKGQFCLGVCYQLSNNLAEALNWYRKAAEQGYVNAQFNLGSHYQSGDGITQNLSLAMYWYLKAAEQGDESALREYNQLYEAGYRPSPEP